MDGTLRTALLLGAIPAVALLNFGNIVLFKTVSQNIISGMQKFAAGALFAIILVEVMLDLLIANHFGALTAFSLGILLMIGIKWLTRKLNRFRNAQHKIEVAVITEALIYLFICGLFIGGGFVAGVSEGILITLALGTEVLAIGCSTAADLQAAGAVRTRISLLLAGVSLPLLVSAILGVMLLRGRLGVDLDVLFAFGLAALLLRGIEGLIDTRDNLSGNATLFIFSLGMLLFLFLASWLGKRHVDHPGQKKVVLQQLLQ